MREITLTITPEVCARWRWSAEVRWWLAATCARIACLWIDLSVWLSDDYNIEVSTRRPGRWNEE